MKNRMKIGSFAALLAGILFASGLLHAEESQRPNPQTDPERNGMKLFRQRCSVCHVRVAPGERTYGPVLSMENVSQPQSAVREIILKGSARMPGFAYALQPKQVDDIIAYLKMVPKESPEQRHPSGGVNPAD